MTAEQVWQEVRFVSVVAANIVHSWLHPHFIHRPSQKIRKTTAPEFTLALLFYTPNVLLPAHPLPSVLPPRAAACCGFFVGRRYGGGRRGTMNNC